MNTERRTTWWVAGLAGLVLAALTAWVVVDGNTPPTWHSPFGMLVPESRSPVVEP